jgi:hypothetical protein
MTQLVKIRPAPPLSQSLVKTLGCPRSYKAIVIDGLKPPPSGPSDRGTEVHEVAAAYTDYCVARKVPGDWTAFDRIAASVGAEAFAILEGVRDNYVVDFEHVVGTEIWFCLDDNFNVVIAPKGSREWSREEKEEWAAHNGVAYAGTIDIGLLMDTEGGIDDWKSNIRPFDAPDQQSDQYALAWFLMNPELETVTFRFRFVRYRNCERTADYTRADLPRLMSALEHWRAKQLAIHEHPERAEAIPSKQCLYCPLLNQGCPIDPAVNPYAGRDPLQWTKRLVYLTRAMKQAKEILKEALEATGEPIEYVDGTGERYFFGKKATESEVFPLFEMDAMRKVVIRDDQGRPRMPIAEALENWFDVAPDDAPLFKGINISSTGLKAPLKAGKRAIIHQAVMDNTRKVTKVKLGLHQPDDDPEEEARERDGE